MLKKSIKSDVGFRIPKMNLSTLDILFSITLFIVTLLFIYQTSFFHTDTLSALYMLILLGISVLYQYLRMGKLRKQSWYLVVFLCIDILPNIIYQNQPFLKMLNFLFFNIVYAYWFLECGHHLIKEEESDWIINDLLHAIFHAPFHYLSSSFRLCKNTFPFKLNDSLKILLGLCFSIPLLFLIIPLLMRADNMFAYYIEQIHFDEAFIFRWLMTLFFTFPLFFYYLSLSYGNIAHSTDSLYQEDIMLQKRKRLSFLPSTICTTIELVLCATYFLFFIAGIQGIVSSMGMNRDVFSYSDFARQGFFELCVIATLNLTIIITINVTSESRTPFAIWVERFLIIFTVLLVFCAMMKLYLYISAYNALTYLRIYAAWFLCLLLGIFLLLLFRKKDGTPHILWLIRFVMAAFLLLNLMNVPHWVNSSDDENAPYILNEYHEE